MGVLQENGKHRVKELLCPTDDGICWRGGHVEVEQLCPSSPLPLCVPLPRGKKEWQVSEGSKKAHKVLVANSTLSMGIGVFALLVGKEIKR